MSRFRTSLASPEAVTWSPLFRNLRELALPARDILVAGSAPLLLRGLRQEIADVDVVARGSAWTAAQRLGSAPAAAPYQGRRAVKLLDGMIEIVDGWFPDWFDQDQLFACAELIDGISFMSLEDTLRWKGLLGRAKDLADLRSHFGTTLPWRHCAAA